MTTEQITTSLDISKRLKELGVSQESIFYWNNNKVEYRFFKSLDNEDFLKEFGCSAYTSTELGEILKKVEKHYVWAAACGLIPLPVDILEYEIILKMNEPDFVAEIVLYCLEHEYLKFDKVKNI